MNFPIPKARYKEKSSSFFNFVFSDAIDNKKNNEEKIVSTL